MHRLKLPKYDRPVRYICTRCGGWWEGDANRLIVAGIKGCEPDDPNLQEITSARLMEIAPLDRHRERCSGDIQIVQPDSKEWNRVDPNKRENKKA